MGMKRQVFNPIKQDEDGKKARRVVWSTESINLALKGVNEGRKLIANPFYENNRKLLKNDLVFQRTEEEVMEWGKCAKDVIYFSNTYAQLMTPEGTKHITLRDYQERYLKHLEDHNLSIYLSCRQSSKTTSSALFMLHYIIFNVDKTALILGNKGLTSREILDKIKKIYIELPYFLKPGVMKWNESEVVLDNGCRILAENTVVNSGISFTVHCVLADEFAHVNPNILDKFYNNLFPVITAGNARFMITSTQNGNNLFARLYNAAREGLNDYGAFVTTWDEVPDWDKVNKRWVKRDEAWHQRQIANYGGEEGFNKQFGVSFDVGANTLISAKKLEAHARNCNQFVAMDMPSVPDSDHFFLMPGYNVEDLQKEFLIITVDISEGLGSDYTVFTLNRLTGDKTTETIGFYRQNAKNTEECAHILRWFCIKMLSPNHYIISLEWNLNGELFVKCLKEAIENDPESIDRFDESCIVKYWNDEKTKFTLGKRITSKSKPWGLKEFKQRFEAGKIVNNSIQFSNELYNFTDIRGTGSYEASYGNDDLVMSQMQVCFVFDTNMYKELQEYAAMYANVKDRPVVQDTVMPADQSGFFDIFAYADQYNMQAIPGMAFPPQS